MTLLQSVCSSLSNCSTDIPGVTAAEALGAEHRADDAGEGGTAEQHRLQENSEFGQTGRDEKEGESFSDLKK